MKQLKNPQGSAMAVLLAAHEKSQPVRFTAKTKQGYTVEFTATIREVSRAFSVLGIGLGEVTASKVIDTRAKRKAIKN